MAARHESNAAMMGRTVKNQRVAIGTTLRMPPSSG